MVCKKTCKKDIRNEKIGQWRMRVCNNKKCYKKNLLKGIFGNIYMEEGKIFGKK